MLYRVLGVLITASCLGFSDVEFDRVFGFGASGFDQGSRTVARGKLSTPGVPWKGFRTV